MKLNLGGDSEAGFGQDFEVEVQAESEAGVESRFGGDSEARFGQDFEF